MTTHCIKARRTRSAGVGWVTQEKNFYHLFSVFFTPPNLSSFIFCLFHSFFLGLPPTHRQKQVNFVFPPTPFYHTMILLRTSYSCVCACVLIQYFLTTPVYTKLVRYISWAHQIRGGRSTLEFFVRVFLSSPSVFLRGYRGSHRRKVNTRGFLFV